MFEHAPLGSLHSSANCHTTAVYTPLYPSTLSLYTYTAWGCFVSETDEPCNCHEQHSNNVHACEAQLAQVLAIDCTPPPPPLWQVTYTRAGCIVAECNKCAW